MKTIFIVLAMFFTSALTKAQTQNSEQLIQAPKAIDEAKQEETFVIVEKMPEFPGGTGALVQYLSNNIKYPEESRKMGVEGRVYVKFVVDKTGTIGDVQIIRSIEDGKPLETEAIRVVKAMPIWTPGTQGGKAVSVYFTLPITFKLNSTPEQKK